MSAETKRIDPAAIASITTGIVMVEFAKIHEAIEWVMGHPVWTHEIPDACDDAVRLVLEQFPDMPTTKPADWAAEAARLRTKYGELIEVQRGTLQRTASPIETARRKVRRGESNVG